MITDKNVIEALDAYLATLPQGVYSYPGGDLMYSVKKRTILAILNIAPSYNDESNTPRLHYIARMEYDNGTVMSRDMRSVLLDAFLEHSPHVRGTLLGRNLEIL